jgi:aconitate hydratase
MASLDSFKCRKTLTVGAKSYEIYSLKAAEKNGLSGVSQLPFSLKIVLENLLRNEDGRSVKRKTSRRSPRGPAIAARRSTKSRSVRRGC